MYEELPEVLISTPERNKTKLRKVNIGQVERLGHLLVLCYDYLREDEVPMTPFLAACASVVPVAFYPDGSLANVLPLELKEDRFGMLFEVRILAEPIGKPLVVFEPERLYPEAPICY